MLGTDRSEAGVTNKLTYTHRPLEPHFVRSEILKGVMIKIQVWYRVSFSN